MKHWTEQIHPVQPVDEGYIYEEVRNLKTVIEILPFFLNNFKTRFR